MPESNIQDCTAQAMLYLTKDLEPDEAAAFEKRLELDPQCQDALVAAVRLWPGIGTPQEPHPSLVFRERVRARLLRVRQSKTVRDRLLPFAYALTGGVAAALLLVALNPGRWLGPAPAPTLIVNQAPEISTGGPAAEVIYSDLSNTERLQKVRQTEEVRRQKHHDLKHHTPLLNPMPKPPPMSSRSMM
jgi:hypothetical protein